MFYTSLGRLLMVDLGEDEEKFDAFMIPITQSFESLGQVLLNSGSSESTLLNLFFKLANPGLFFNLFCVSSK